MVLKKVRFWESHAGTIFNDRSRVRLELREPVNESRVDHGIRAGCNVTVSTRLKRAGIDCSLKGANAISALCCCCRPSGRFFSAACWAIGMSPDYLVPVFHMTRTNFHESSDCSLITRKNLA